MAKKADRASKLFKGEKFVISGAVPGYTRKEFQSDVLEKVGAVLTKSISRNVDYLITTEDQVETGTAKVILAKGYGITLVTGEWLVDSIVEGKKLPLSDYILGEEGSKKTKSKKRKKVESDDDEDDDDDDEEEDEKEAPKKKKAKGNTKALFKGLKFAITGAVAGYTRNEFKQNVLMKLGALQASGVTRNTDYLLSTASQVSSGTSKLDDARAKGVSIVSADWLIDSLEAGKKLSEADYILGGKGSSSKKKTVTATKKKTVKKSVTKSSSGSSKELFKGKVFVISGKIPDYTRAEFKQKYVVDLGAKLGSSITKATDYVITTEESAESGDTAKLDAAREKGVPVVSFEWLVDCVDEGEVLDTDDFVI